MTNTEEQKYLTLMADVAMFGDRREDRTRVGTSSIFSPAPLEFYIRDTFPLITTKKMAWKSIVAETLWFTQGRYDLESLRADGCTWWDPWEKEDGTLGPVYGKQLRHWTRPDGSEFDQLAWIINEIKTNPTSRRLVATMWNPGELDEMALPACHGALIQFYATTKSNELDLTVNIRSSDMFLGLPTNIASYALLLRMVAQVTTRVPGYLKVILGDAHVYNNHMNQVWQQVGREPYPFPTLEIDPTITNIDDFRPEHFTLSDYLHHPHISGRVAV